MTTLTLVDADTLIGWGGGDSSGDREASYRLLAISQALADGMYGAPGLYESMTSHLFPIGGAGRAPLNG